MDFLEMEIARCIKEIDLCKKEYDGLCILSPQKKREIEHYNNILAEKSIALTIGGKYLEALKNRLASEKNS